MRRLLASAGPICALAFAAAVLAALALAAAVLGPALPGVAHPLVPQGPDGVPQCSTCHGPGADPSALPAGTTADPPPADHATYSRESCATCHAAIAATSPTAVSYSECIACHGKKDGVLKLASGQTVSTFIDLNAFRSSVHGNLACAKCHPREETVPHPPIDVGTARALTMEKSAVCTTCHVGRERGAAACTDCHVTHAVAPPVERPLFGGPLERECAPAPAGPAAGWGAAAVLGSAIGMVTAGGVWWTMRRRMRRHVRSAAADGENGGRDE